MKRMLFINLICILSCLSTKTLAQVGTTSNTKNDPPSIEGAWHSVDNKEFLLISDGFFSSVAQDSTGKWKDIHAGTYNLDNANTATLKVTHSSYAYRIGYLHTIEYDVNGEKLTFNLYKKMIDPKAGDITSHMPKDQQTQYVRAKK